MIKGSMGVRVLTLAEALSMLFLGYFGFVRPWLLEWGATNQESHSELAGDGIILHAVSQQTRAIAIHASVEKVWPWLAQLGQDRGGFYSFDLLENLAGCQMPSPDRLQPDRQSWRLGEKLWMYPPEQAGGIGFATLRDYIPGRALCFGAHAIGAPADKEDGSWSFVLEPKDASNTRLLIRGRQAQGQSLLGMAFDRLFFEPIHFVMERRTMLGIKQLAEGTDRGRIWNNVHVAFFAIAFGLWITAAIMVLRQRDWRMPLAVFLATGVVFQIITLGQPPLALGLILLLVVGVLLIRCSGKNIRLGKHVNAGRTVTA